MVIFVGNIGRLKCQMSLIAWNLSLYGAYHPPDPVYDPVDLLEYMSDTCDQILAYDPKAKIIIAGDID